MQDAEVEFPSGDGSNKCCGDKLHIVQILQYSLSGSLLLLSHKHCNINAVKDLSAKLWSLKENILLTPPTHAIPTLQARMGKPIRTKMDKFMNNCEMPLHHGTTNAMPWCCNNDAIKM